MVKKPKHEALPLLSSAEVKNALSFTLEWLMKLTRNFSRVDGNAAEMRTGYLQGRNVKRYCRTDLLIIVNMCIWSFNCLINNIPNVTVEWVDRLSLHSIRSWVEIPARRPPILFFSGRPHRCWSLWYPLDIRIVLYINSYGSVRFYRCCYAISDYWYCRV
jgi:hypothetical protein